MDEAARALGLATGREPGAILADLGARLTQSGALALVTGAWLELETAAADAVARAGLPIPEGGSGPALVARLLREGLIDRDLTQEIDRLAALRARAVHGIAAPDADDAFELARRGDRDARCGWSGDRSAPDLLRSRSWRSRVGPTSDPAM